MSNVVINGVGSNATSPLQQILNEQSIEPGTQIGYQTCKLIWEYHPLGGKLVEKPILLALSKEREITIDCEPSDILKKEFIKIWDELECTDYIRDTMFLSRAYGASALILGIKDKPTTEAVNYWELADKEIFFNRLDPLNLAGSIVTNQNPNSPEFQRPNEHITASGQKYHPSRSLVVFCGTPIYLAFQPSAFGFTGRSVFQRILYPLKSYIQTMITDDMVATKAGLLIVKAEQPGSIGTRFAQKFLGLKRSALKTGVTNNVLSVGLQDSIESVDLNNTAVAMNTARDNIIANISAGADVPSSIIKDEALSRGFGEGTEDTKVVVQYLDSIRREITPLMNFMEKIVMHRAWNKTFYDSIQDAYPEYSNISYESAFYTWENAFKSDWQSMMEESESEKIKISEIKMKGVTDVLRTLLPIADPDNRAKLVEWAQNNLNENIDMFSSTFDLDYDELSSYIPPESVFKEEKVGGHE